MPRAVAMPGVMLALTLLLAGAIALDGPLLLLAGALVLVVASLGMEVVLRGAAPGEAVVWTDRTTYYPLPALLALACLLLVRHPLIDSVLAPVLGSSAATLIGRGFMLLLSALLLFYCLSAERDSFLLRPPPTSAARFVLLTLVIIGAFVLFGTIYGTKERTLITGSAVGLVAAALALELYRIEPADSARTWLLAGVTGLVLAETTWALNYLTLDAVRGGAVLILVFYVLSGLVQYARVGVLTRRVALEYGAIGLVGLLFVLVSPAA